MGKSDISWTEFTWNPTTGCDKVSPGCRSCYAEVMHKRLMAMFPKKYSKPFLGNVQTHTDELLKPLKWGKGKMVFVDSMSDLFHKDVPEEFIKLVFSVMASTEHTYQVLTKRADRMFEIVSRMDWVHGLLLYDKHILVNNCLGFGGKSKIGPFLPPNIWLGVSCEDQQRANERIPFLVKTPAAVRFLSCEPLIGSIILSWNENHFRVEDGKANLSWIIAGGESGRMTRSMDLAWPRSLRDQCAAAGIPFFMKQLSKKDTLDYKNFDSFPQDLQIRQWPI